jgi:hypothetical protein
VQNKQKRRITRFFDIVGFGSTQGLLMPHPLLLASIARLDSESLISLKLLYGINLFVITRKSANWMGTKSGKSLPMKKSARTCVCITERRKRVREKEGRGPAWSQAM